MENSPIQFNDDHKKMMYIAYALFAVSIVFGGITTIVGVIFIYIKRKEMLGTFYYDHSAFLLRTFWGSIIALIIGVMLKLLLIGNVILFAIPIWYLFRVIYGAIKLHENKSVTPTGWLI